MEFPAHTARRGEALQPATIEHARLAVGGPGAAVAGDWELPGRRGRRFYEITPEGEAERGRLAGRLVPHLDAVVASVEAIRAELLEH